MIVVQDVHMTKDESFPKFQKLLHKQSAVYTGAKVFLDNKMEICN
jgi:hypothetical protein